MPEASNKKVDRIWQRRFDIFNGGGWMWTPWETYTTNIDLAEGKPNVSRDRVEFRYSDDNGTTWNKWECDEEAS